MSERLPPWPRAILHLDMDAFFVNVYLLEHPEDKGIPLVVGGRPDVRGVVASASYEARAFGVRSAMPAARALQLCPDLKFVGHNWPLIRSSSRAVMSILREYGPVEQMSVDEAYVDLTGTPLPATMAARIRERVKAETDLPASVGLATSKLVAKVASDHDKPEGFTIVTPGLEADFLAPLPVRAIHGIGPRTTERLAQLNIHTCAELAGAELAILQGAFGNQGPLLQLRSRGVDDRPVESEPGLAKSISQEITFNEDINDADYLRDRLQSMSISLGESLQGRELVAHTVTVKFRWSDFTTFTRQRSVVVGIDDGDEIYRLAEAIWQENWPPGQRMRLLGVGVSKIEAPQERQLRLDFQG
ncbi:MAG: DNA polymerase IV [Anaerolineales bacterium]|nr:DNA polymerase IV [Anaerolineales bacterium]MCB0019157.1 DNA polymerase IV [Anaerolineales bacterium]MCB8960385.1 DNA polymerase IV [Ardenticatenales bacterium]